jgi:hypothetical protein
MFIFPIIFFGLFAAKKATHCEIPVPHSVGFTLGILAGLVVAIAFFIQHTDSPGLQAHTITFFI